LPWNSQQQIRSRTHAAREDSQSSGQRRRRIAELENSIQLSTIVEPATINSSQSPTEKKKKEKVVVNRIRVIMKPNRVTWWLCSIICIVLVCVQFEGCVGSKTKRRDEAYVTLLYGDEFLLGVRVLGKSIRNTGSSKDMVVLVSDGVSDYAKSLLRVIIIFFLMGLPQDLKFLTLLCGLRF